MKSQKPSKPSCDVLSVTLLCVTLLIGFVFFAPSNISFFIIPTIWILLFGWVSFISKIISYVNSDILLIIFEGIGTILLLIAGFQWFIFWFYQNYHYSIEVTERQLKPKWHLRWTIIGVAIFFLMFTISISITGLIHETTWLVSSPFTDVYFGKATSTAATRLVLKHMGDKLESYQLEHHHLPIVDQPIPFKELEIPDYHNSYIDQWGMPILYSSDGHSYVLRSYGSNRILGGGTGKFDDIVYVDGLLY